jgi:hypothetical protein
VKTSKRRSNRRLFRQLPSNAKAANKIYKAFSLGRGSWVWARIAQTFPIAYCLKARCRLRARFATSFDLWWSLEQPRWRAWAATPHQNWLRL